MAYGTLNLLRLYGRDQVFRAQYLLRKFTRGRGNDTIVLCNSYPKSGTHLLFQILSAIPGFKAWHDLVSVKALSGVMNTASHIRWKLGSAPTGAIVRSHLMYCEEIFEILKERKYVLFFIYRDLRDTALSHAKWVYTKKREFLYPIYRYHLRTDDERLMASIVGTPLGSPFGSNSSQPSIGQDFSRWQGWLSHRDTMAIRFEDLVGARGGGDEEKRRETIKNIFKHINVNFSDAEIESHFSSEAMEPSASHTFRKGKIGGWKSAFKHEHKENFKLVAGKSLIELGYEKDFNW